MFNKFFKTSVLLVLVVASLFLVLPTSYAQAACTFSEPGILGKDPAVITLNENIGYTLTGNQECANKNVIAEIFGKEGFDFLIRTVITKANSSGLAIFKNISFNASDFTGRRGDQTVYMKVKAEDGSSNQITSPNIIVKLSAGGGCTLTTAQWRWSFSAQPILGSPMDLVVNGFSCSNFGVNIEIKEQDVGLGDDSMGFVKATFNSQGTQAIGKWTVDGSKDDDNIGSYIFYFEAAAGSSRVKSNQLQIPLRSQNGCLNCNAVTAPSTCECADGFSGPRPFAGTCDAVCKDHIGDALGGGGGTCGNNKCDAGENPTNCSQDCKPNVCGNNVCETAIGEKYQTCPKDCIKPGETQTFVFKLDNPLEADNFIELIDVLAIWLFNLAIPVVVVMIVYAGVMFLTSRGEPAKVTKARQILLYAVVGFAIILIGKGFITLIESILNIGTGP